MRTWLTSESAARGHPDKVCDQIADAILDAILEKDPKARVACEVAVLKDRVHIMGEISSSFAPDYEKIARRVIKNIGYTEPERGFDADTCEVDVRINTQSPDIAAGLNRRGGPDLGAGDQGIIFGFACRDTKSLMPLPVTLAHALTSRLEYVRTCGAVPFLLPDGKAQVTIEYEDGEAKRISTVVVSAQHREETKLDTLRSLLLDKVVNEVLPGSLLDDATLIYINPMGRFVVGGPAGDTGFSGKKTVSDSYGGAARCGGGSFYGKDPTKMDRSGAYMARFIAKNIVNAGLAVKCEVQLAYAIGLSDPVSVGIDTFRTGTVQDEKLALWVTKNIDLRPAMIIERFGLQRPIYERLSCLGQFGSEAEGMPWEKTELSSMLTSAFRI